MDQAFLALWWVTAPFIDNECPTACASVVRTHNFFHNLRLGFAAQADYIFASEFQ